MSEYSIFLSQNELTLSRLILLAELPDSARSNEPVHGLTPRTILIRCAAEKNSRCQGNFNVMSCDTKEMPFNYRAFHYNVQQSCI